MKFSVSREALLKPLQLVAGVVERRQTLPVLANVLIVLEQDRLSMTGTDLEVEIVARVQLAEAAESDGELTVPARKLVDICRSLPDDAMLHFSEENPRVILKSARRRFTLSTLPANDFPNVEQGTGDLQFTCEQQDIKRLIDRTGFAMAQQDVRYYLNGMLWEVQEGQLRAVATDGHRLAMCTRAVSVSTPITTQAILPRKGVIELARLLDGQGSVEIVLGSNHIRVATEAYTFTSKLVDGKFPDYERVLPRGGNKLVFGDRNDLRQAFGRTAILSNEKYRGVRLLLTDGQLTIVANNPEQEEAEEQVAVDYSGDQLEIGFNVSYLQDVTGVLSSDNIKMTLSDSNSSALLEEPDGGDSVYVVMPMRL